MLSQNHYGHIAGVTVKDNKGKGLVELSIPLSVMDKVT
jgi:hypothetical protein